MEHVFMVFGGSFSVSINFGVPVFSVSMTFFSFLQGFKFVYGVQFFCIILYASDLILKALLRDLGAVCGRRPISPLCILHPLWPL